MYRLNIDSITHKILGYENINKYLKIYKDDIIVDDVSGFKIGEYYENGRSVKKEVIDDFSDQLGTLYAEMQKIGTKSKSQIIEELIVEQNMDMAQAIRTAREILENRESQRKEIQKKIGKAIEQHRQDTIDYWKKEHKKKEE